MTVYHPQRRQASLIVFGRCWKVGWPLSAWRSVARMTLYGSLVPQLIRSTAGARDSAETLKQFCFIHLRPRPWIPQSRRGLPRSHRGQKTWQPLNAALCLPDGICPGKSCRFWSARCATSSSLQLPAPCLACPAAVWTACPLVRAAAPFLP